MTPEPTVQPLSYVKRVWFFRLLAVFFFMAMPVFVFYAMGYRIDLTNTTSNIVSVGGMYISAEADGIEMFVDDMPVENMRFFQSAAYIQNLQSGVHQIHVQRDGLQTWVKELPVFSHIVTEAYAFNMPTVPRIRIVSAWEHEGAAVQFLKSTSTPLLQYASTTNTLYATTSVATSTYTINSEYKYVVSLFDTATATNTIDMVNGAVKTIEQRFSFATDTLQIATVIATTTKEWQDIELFESEGDVYARWAGDREDIPYYFCITYTSPATTSLQYGAHVEKAMAAQLIDSVDFEDPDIDGDQLCRDRIKIDRKRQNIVWFDFYPNNPNLVLLLLEDGLYVVEIDDRAWQNVQRLYPGRDLHIVLDGGHIFVFDGRSYFEVLTEMES